MSVDYGSSNAKKYLVPRRDWCKYVARGMYTYALQPIDMMQGKLRKGPSQRSGLLDPRLCG